MLCINGIASSCNETCSYSLDGINSSLWKADSLGCNDYRKNNYNLIEQKEEKIKGLTECQIEYLFGKPNSKNTHSGVYRIYYWIEPGPQCTISTTDTPFVAKLYFQFNQDKKVVGIGEVIP